MKNKNTDSRHLAKLLVACPLLVSFGLLANMAPLTAAQHYQPAEVQPIWMKIDLNADGLVDLFVEREVARFVE